MMFTMNTTATVKSINGGNFEATDVTGAVTLDANGKGSLDIPSKDMDVYNDEQTITATVKSINGGNFENVTFNFETTNPPQAECNI